MYYIWKITDDYPESYWLKYSKESPKKVSLKKGSYYDGENVKFIFQLDKKIDKDRITKFDNLESDGPILISKKFADLIKKIALNDIQLFEAEVWIKGELIKEYYVLNIIKTVACIDIEKSEKLYISDNDPTAYIINKAKFIETDLGNIMIARAKENAMSTIIVSEEFKNECIKANINGIYFEKYN